MYIYGCTVKTTHYEFNLLQNYRSIFGENEAFNLYFFIKHEYVSYCIYYYNHTI